MLEQPLRVYDICFVVVLSLPVVKEMNVHTLKQNLFKEKKRKKRKENMVYSGCVYNIYFCNYGFM